MAPDVVDEPRGAEPPGQGDGGADGEDRCPQGHERVAVEQRHRAVGDVVTVEAVHRRGPKADGGETALGAANGLGRAGGPRSEQQQVEVRRIGLRPIDDGAGRHAAVALDPLGGGRIIDQDDPVVVETEVESGDQRRTLEVGDEQLTVRAPHVVGQCLAPPSGVDPRDHCSGQGGTSQPQQVVGNVPQQDADVERALPAHLGQHRGPGRGLVDHLPPAPLLVLEPETDAVVLRSSHQQVGHTRDEGVDAHRPSSTSRLWIAVPSRPSTSHRVDWANPTPVVPNRVRASRQTHSPTGGRTMDTVRSGLMNEAEPNAARPTRRC